MSREIEVKSVLNKLKHRDSWFLCDYTVNMYSSCSFNCLYCYICGSKYGSNLEESVTIKSNGIEVLDRQLFNRAKKKDHGIVVLSSSTDPYLPHEKKHELSRQALQLLAKHQFPIHIITKSDLIERDFDLLHQIDQTAILPESLKGLNRGAIISYSFSTLDARIGKIFEPGATAPTRRLEAVAKTVKEGFHTGISMMPMFPYISDTGESLRQFFTTFSEMKLNYVLPATITLFGNQSSDSKTLMFAAIENHFPVLLPKYQRLFENGTETPAYYREAFSKKMQELSLEFGLDLKIIP